MKSAVRSNGKNESRRNSKQHTIKGVGTEIIVEVVVIIVHVNRVLATDLVNRSQPLKWMMMASLLLLVEEQKDTLHPHRNLKHRSPLKPSKLLRRSSLFMFFRKSAQLLAQ